MQRFQQGNIEWLQFDLLSDIPHLKHAVFLRNGGHSPAPFNSLNMSYDVGDQNSNVAANFKLVQQIFQNQDQEKFIKPFWTKQCHGKQIIRLYPDSSSESLNYDVLATSFPGLNLIITHADCQATIFYDPTNKAIANVHAGWRGNVLNIYAETIHFMQKNFGSRPQELLVCISPSLGPEDAEFIHYNQELPPEFWEFQIKPTYFDFWSISEYQLQAAGVLPHHIEIARISTYSNPHDYFSYRYQKTTGRHATCVALY